MVDCAYGEDNNARHEEATDFKVPLVGWAEKIVRRRLKDHPEGYLFPSYGKAGHWEQKSIQSRVYYHQRYSQTSPERSRARLTVTHWAPHDLRRTSRTFLAHWAALGTLVKSFWATRSGQVFVDI